MKKLNQFIITSLLVISLPFLFLSCKQDEPVCEDCDPNITHITSNTLLNPNRGTYPTTQETNLDFDGNGIIDAQITFKTTSLFISGETYATQELYIEGKNRSQVAKLIGLKKDSSSVGTSTKETVIPHARLAGTFIDGSFAYVDELTPSGGLPSSFAKLSSELYVWVADEITKSVILLDNWKNKCETLNTNKSYIPIELTLPNNPENEKNYGWIEITYVDVASGTDYYLTGYAYNLITNNPITAGRY